MSRASPRISRILLASALALAPAAAATAMAEPVPVTDGIIPRPICVPIIKCLPKAAGTLQLQASPGESGGRQIEVLAWGWGAVDLPPAGSADPQEGGEILSGVEDRATAEASSKKRGAGQVTVSDMNVTMKADKASPTLMSKPRPGYEREPGKLEVPNLSVAPDQAETPPPSGMVTMLVPAGTCVQGAHYSTVTLQSEGTAYELHDVTVAECAPASVAKGRNVDKQKLHYVQVVKAGWDIKANKKL